MLRRFRRRLLPPLVAVLFGLVGVTAVAGPAQASGVPGFGTLRQSTYISGFGPGVVAYWDWCEDSGTKIERIFLEDARYSTCGSSGSWVYGFVALTTHSSTSHTLEVCNGLSWNHFDGTVDPANSSGGSTGNLISYPASPGSCYTSTKGYPMRKFEAVAESDYEVYVYSMWVAPYPA